MVNPPSSAGFVFAWLHAYRGAIEQISLPCPRTSAICPSYEVARRRLSSVVCSEGSEMFWVIYGESQIKVFHYTMRER